MLQEEHENGSVSALRWQEDLAKDSQRIAKAGSFRMALIQYPYSMSLPHIHVL